jgi:hypothetical protein
MWKETAQEVTAASGTAVTNGIAVWSWLAHVTDLLQLVVTAFGVLTGYVTYKYITAKRKLMEEQLREKEMEHKE